MVFSRPGAVFLLLLFALCIKGCIVRISTPEEVNNIISNDLNMTTAALKANPKVYWIWNHRRWCLENVPDGPEGDKDGWKKANWDRELFFVEKMLDADSRNCK
jgi:geranylgeranyl transferase type-2 subunit alpha